MQNAECKIKETILSFCILHSAFCIEKVMRLALGKRKPHYFGGRKL
jgi:hypothetical protein